MVEVNVSASSRYMAALGVDTRFVLPDVSMPSCSVEDSWSKPVRRLLRNPAAPFYRHPITQLPATYVFHPKPMEEIEEEEDEEREQLSSQRSCASSDSSILQPCTEHSEEDSGRGTCASSGAPCCDPDCELSDVDEEQEPPVEEQPCEWNVGCVVEPMTESELDYVERAHRYSKFLDVYSEPSLRFVAVPPYSFVLPRIVGESGYQSESSPPLPVDSPCPGLNSSSGVQTFAAAAASGLSPSNTAATSVAANTTTVELPSAAAASATVADEATFVTTEAHQTTFTCPQTSQLSHGVHFEISEMDVLSEEIWHYHNSVTQSEKMLNRKLHLRDMLYYSICPVFPMCGLYVVGSSLNGFGNNTSDMDLCLMITNKDLDQKTDAVVVLNMILSTLQQVEWVSHQKLILAKVPILRIKFAAPFSDITVDLNANNSVAIKNTHLLCYYSSFDWRVRPLVSVVKEWAKRKGINDANRSSFTSYSLVLMVIHYLQCGTDPGVLPSLQQMFPRRFANKCDVRTLNITLPLDTPATTEWHYSDKSTLGELLIGFLDYYANKFDYDRDAISVRLGKRIDRAVIARQRPNGGYQQNGTNWRSQWRCICIEEPFTYSNTAHSIYDEMVFDAIKAAFREAHQELDSTRDLKRLLDCKPITVNAPMGGAMVYVSSFNSTRDASTGSITADSPTSGASRRSTPRGSSSASSISTAHSGASSSGSSSSSDYGEDQDHDRLADVSEVTGVPLRRHSKSRGRRLARPNGVSNGSGGPVIPVCVPNTAPQIAVTTGAVTAAEH
ncbi:PAP/25A associated domain protein [Oesophagostomum dentatum]|uniref:polynucleotide adenylyltransferase n=1 Tax=Oesophagostomum dentatum TaxID=61180 RepID=A0A0B1TFP1_OESDE|nr:PAP/25A associated domain protein [Oesophagostomum dentatum]